MASLPMMAVKGDGASNKYLIKQNVNMEPGYVKQAAAVSGVWSECVHYNIENICVALWKP